MTHPMTDLHFISRAPKTTPDARMAPLVALLAREPNTMLTALAEALSEFAARAFLAGEGKV